MSKITALLLIQVVLLLMGCATPRQQCAKPDVVAEYTSYDECVADKEEARQRRVAAFQGLAAGTPQQNQQSTQSQQDNQNATLVEPQQQFTPIKQTDFTCMNRCRTNGYVYGFCQNQCSY